MEAGMGTIITSTATTAQPQGRRRKNGLGFWTGRILLGLVIALVALAATGAIYQAFATAIDRRVYPPPGQLVDVGGYQIHIHCIGAGSPTVILESAFPGTSADWAWVQPQIANTTRVCAYDRAGMGWSELGPEPRDASQIAAELHRLLDGAGIHAPYVLVGHSFGGLIVRGYAAHYPNELAGMVLVDAMHPDVLTRLPPEFAAGFTPGEPVLALFPILAGLGVTRLGLVDPFPVDPNLPAQQHAAITALNVSTKSTIAIAGELRAIPAALAQVRAAGDLGNTPLVVVTSENTYPGSPQAQHSWNELQHDLVALSSNSMQRTIAGATHESLVYSQKDAQMTIAAIRQVVEAARAGQPLVR
jgi:pimeloyl-ACP methyl ester carboxylesterase